MRSKPDVIEQKKTLSSGLYVVATPIGNLSDLSLRAIEVLKNVDVIACEDTRITSKILNKHSIETKMITYHEHNANRARLNLTKLLKAGKSIALVSDAGTPTISDPGYKLVRECIENDLGITTIPGASAAITGLTLSGLPTNRFLFAGFLNSKKAQRKRELIELSKVPATLVFYESAKRLLITLDDMAKYLGDRPAAIARELTKRHEEVRRDTLSILSKHYHTVGAPKGEVVIFVSPPLKPPPLSDSDLDDLILKQLRTLSVRDTTAKIAFETETPKRRVYSRAIKLFRKQQ
jgi:16S rRNA (cytidine1402-2'-O)-methyltransferase